MDQTALVTVYTQAYNTKPYLEQCISSVLTQTYSNFEYLLVDNGCTDGSSEIINAFAEKDRRIKPFCFQQNQFGPRVKITKEYATGKYYAVLDSDDWWEPDFLERMLELLEGNDLDLAVTGTMQYFEADHSSQMLRKLEQPVVLTQKQFAQYYPNLWTFPSTVWASVMKTDIVRSIDYSAIQNNRYPYGADTMIMLQYIKQCNRIAIDNSALYHYRIHPKSVTYQYHPRRFDANIASYEQIRGFLELHQTFDPSKQEWLKRVHLSSMLVTLQLLRDSALPPDEKLAECARIVEYPLTGEALTNHCTEREQWFSLMWEIAFSNIFKESEISIEHLRAVLQALAPNCATAIHPTDLVLFVREPELQKSLLKDNREQLAYQVLRLISQKQYTKQYDLGQMLCNLIPDDSLLHGISDIRFFREYAESCTLIFGKKYREALEQMTGMLFQKKKLYAGEVFLNLYLTVAALEGEASAFLFGKLQLAKLYLNQDCLPECRTIVDDLTGMGIENDELDVLRHQLEEIGG